MSILERGGEEKELIFTRVHSLHLPLSGTGVEERRQEKLSKPANTTAQRYEHRVQTHGTENAIHFLLDRY